MFCRELILGEATVVVVTPGWVVSVIVPSVADAKSSFLAVQVATGCEGVPGRDTGA